MIKIRSISTNLGAAICTVEFQDIDETHPLQRVRNTFTVEVEGKYIDAADPELMAKLEELLSENA